MIVTQKKEVAPEVLGFIKTRYGNVDIDVASVPRKDIKNAIMKGNNIGAVFTFEGELSQKMIKKITKCGATITEIAFDPLKKLTKYGQVHVAA